MPGENQPSYDDLQRQIAALRIQSGQTGVPVESVHLAPGYAGPLKTETASTDRYAVTSWGQTGFDFTTPSGQTCRLRKLNPAKLAASGVLDKITRLPGIAQTEIDRAEGAPPPPANVEMPDAGAVQALTDLLETLIPMAVEQPTVHPLPAEGESRIEGRIYVDSIDFGDQVAIMERVTGGLKAYDNFREQS